MKDTGTSQPDPLALDRILGSYHRINKYFYEFRNNQLGSYNDRVNAQILYATLISAVITAFLVDFSKNLDDDTSTQATNSTQLLVTGSTSNSVQQTSSIDSIEFAVFVLWTVSLVMSLCDLAMAIVTKLLLSSYEEKLLDKKFELISQYFDETQRKPSFQLEAKLREDNRFMKNVQPLDAPGSLFSLPLWIFVVPFSTLIIVPLILTQALIFRTIFRTSTISMVDLCFRAWKRLFSSLDIFVQLSVVNLLAVIVFFTGVVVRFATTPIKIVSIAIGAFFAFFLVLMTPYTINKLNIDAQGFPEGDTINVPVKPADKAGLWAGLWERVDPVPVVQSLWKSVDPVVQRLWRLLLAPIRWVRGRFRGRSGEGRPNGSESLDKEGTLDV